MSLLTDQEIDNVWPAPPGTNSMLVYARAIEQAVISKLATVSVEPVAWIADYGGDVYTLLAVAAALVQALEEFKAEMADALCADCENGVKYLNEQAADKFRNDYPKVSALIGGKP